MVRGWGRLPPVAAEAGMLIWVSLRVRPPAAPVTPCRARIDATSAAGIGPYAPLTRLSSLVAPWWQWPPWQTWDPPGPRVTRVRPPGEATAGLVVTVISVPTPYSDRSTLACAARTPAAAAVTVMTRP